MSHDVIHIDCSPPLPSDKLERPRPTKRPRSAPVVDLTDEDAGGDAWTRRGAAAPPSRAGSEPWTRRAAPPSRAGGASSAEVEVVDLTSDELTDQLNAFVTQERPPPERPLRPDPSVDVLAQHRTSVRAFLNIKGAALKVERVTENPHSRPGTPLYERFKQAWAGAADARVQLCFHGTAQANVDAICREGLDPRRRAGQALGPGEYFGVGAEISVGYCQGGRKMLVFAVLMDKAGLTNHGATEHVVVCHKVAHQLPLFVVTFKVSRVPPGFAAAIAAIQAGEPLTGELQALLGGPAGIAAMGGMASLAQMFGKGAARRG